ncbi:MAG TPA: sigma-54 dependent transcriptional regulator [Candidatus Eisenbacteria bacterium]|nr:sigma-54 dependent transcriptional regulator [Candidatus Eisenbacteria bacterium]
MSTILCIDEQPAAGELLGRALAAIGHRPVFAATMSEGLQALSREPVDLILSDENMPDANGLELLARLRERGCDVPVIVMAGHGSVEGAVLSVRGGAVDYVTKPLRQESLRIAVAHAIEMDRVRRENEELRRALELAAGPLRLVGASEAIAALRDTLERVAPTQAGVVFVGEPGTGRRLAARLLHESSARRGQPFVAVACRALSESELERTLLGGDSRGALQRAHRGTLLLEEVDELPVALQTRLLRALDERPPAGDGAVAAPLDVRLVATTTRDLAAEVEAGHMVRELHFRLNVVTVPMPTLDERVADVPMLVEHFLARHAARWGVRPAGIAPEALEHLATRRWPGQVAELGNAVERSLLRARGARVSLAAVRESAPADDAWPDGWPVDLDELERLAIQRALGITGGHRARAARLLGISERTLRNKLNGRPQPAELGEIRAS